MLIKQIVRKHALNSKVFLGKLFQKKANARLFSEPQKSFEFEIVYARAHFLNEDRLYKTDKKNKNINELQFYYITR